VDIKSYADVASASQCSVAVAYNRKFSSPGQKAKNVVIVLYSVLYCIVLRSSGSSDISSVSRLYLTDLWKLSANDAVFRVEGHVSMVCKVVLQVDNRMCFTAQARFVQCSRLHQYLISISLSFVVCSECRVRRLNQGIVVLLYFVLFDFSQSCLVLVMSVF